MSNLHTRRRNSRRRPLWSGLLMGSLLVVFLAIFIYAAYLLLSWVQVAAAKTPNLPALALPRLVRPAAESPEQSAAPSLGLFQPAGRGETEVASTSLGRTTILVMGVDSRSKQSSGLTDSILVLTINPQSGAAGMLSIPRDLKIKPSAVNYDVKINMVHSIGEARGTPGGGAVLLRDTVSELIGYPIDYYVRVNFDGFKQIVDLVGGVDIEVQKEIYDDKYPDENYGYLPPIHFLPGLQHMDGDLALKYARTRHADNDYMRAARQQQVISAIVDKVMQSGQLEALLPKLPRLALAMANSVQTDMPIDYAIALARGIDKVDLQNIARVVIDTKMGQVNVNDPNLGYVLIPDMNKVRAAASAIFADASSNVTPEETARQAIREEEARIIVLNGTQEKGLAAKTQAALITGEYNVVNVGNADRADYTETWLIIHGGRTPTTAEALVRRFGISSDRIVSRPADQDVDLTLIVGQDQTAMTR